MLIVLPHKNPYHIKGKEIDTGYIECLEYINIFFLWQPYRKNMTAMNSSWFQSYSFHDDIQS